MSAAEITFDELLRWFKFLLSLPCIFDFSWGYSKYIRHSTEYLEWNISYWCTFMKPKFSCSNWRSLYVSILSCNEYLRCSIKCNKYVISFCSVCVRPGTEYFERESASFVFMVNWLYIAVNRVFEISQGFAKNILDTVHNL